MDSDALTFKQGLEWRASMFFNFVRGIAESKWTQHKQVEWGPNRSRGKRTANGAKWLFISIQITLLTLQGSQLPASVSFDKYSYYYEVIQTANFKRTKKVSNFRIHCVKDRVNKNFDLKKKTPFKSTEEIV